MIIGKRSLLYNDRGERRCARCNEFRPLDDFAMAGNRRRSYCKTCWSVINHAHYAGVSETVETRPDWVPPVWSWGYCPACGWAHSNGRGPAWCECGRQFAQRVEPARVCEHIKA